MRFKIHSISDIITNSSSEVFLVSKDSEIPYWMRLYLENLHNVKGYSCLTL